MRALAGTVLGVLAAACSSGSIAHGPPRQTGPLGAVPAGPPSWLAEPRPTRAAVEDSAGGDAAAIESDDEGSAATEAVVSYPDGEAWVPAWLTRCGRMLAVVHRDGSMEEVPRSEVRSFELAEGERLTAFFGGGARAFPARVLARESGLLQVRYDDGEEEWIAPAQVESVRTAGSAPPGRAPGAQLCGGPDGQGRLPLALVRRFEVRVVASVVECAPGGSALLREGDGQLTVRAASVLTEVELAAGDRVEARFRGHGPFPAIVEHSGSGGAGLLYDDGERGPAGPGDVLRHFVPLRGRPRPAPSAICPMSRTADLRRAHPDRG